MLFSFFWLFRSIITVEIITMTLNMLQFSLTKWATVYPGWFSKTEKNIQFQNPLDMGIHVINSILSKTVASNNINKVENYYQNR